MDLIFRHAWIDLVRPRIDAAVEIVNVGKTALLQQSHRFGAALAAVAMDNDRLLALQFFRPHTAKLVVVNRRKDCRVFAANGTLSIAPQVKLPKFNLERVEMKQTSNQELADAHNQLDRLNRLQHADNPRQNTEHARLRAVWDCVWWRRLRKTAPVAGSAQVRCKHSRLALESEYRAVDVWFSRKNADVVGQIARGEII